MLDTTIIAIYRKARHLIALKLRPPSLKPVMYLLSYLVVSVTPAASQLSDFGREFLQAYGHIRNPNELTHSILISCAITAFIGILIFASWRSFTWAVLMLILSLAAVQTEKTRRLWPIWESSSDYQLLQSYLVQVSVLAFVPMFVWLSRRYQSIIEWSKFSLSFVAGLQGITTVFQFYMLKFGHGNFLSELGLNSASLYTPRDSLNIHREAARLTGLASSPIYLGMILVMTWPALLIQKRTNQSNFTGLIEICFKGLLITCVFWALFLTYTRAAYIGLTIQVGMIVWWSFVRPVNSRKISKYNLVIITIAIASAMACIPATGARVTAIVDTADASISNRLSVFRIAASLLAERPLSGWGPGFFNVLYNNFYRLPHESFSFFNTHSAVINTFMEIGVAGILIGVIAFVGFQWKLMYVKTPSWLLLALAGVLFPLLSDNPASNPAFIFPAIWILGAVCSTSLSLQQLHFCKQLKIDPRVGVAFSGMTATGLLFILWLAGYAHHMKSPHLRLQETLKQTMTSSKQKFAFYLVNNVDRRTYEHNSYKVMKDPSIVKLALAATLIKVAADNDTSSGMTLNMGNPRIFSLQPDQLHRWTLANALYLMLSKSDDSCTNAIFYYLKDDNVSSVTMAILGRPIQVEPAEYVLGKSFLTTDALCYDIRPVYLVAGASARESAILMEFIMKSKGFFAEISRVALRSSRNQCEFYGFPSDLRSIASGKNVTNNRVMRHVTVYKHSGEYWTLSIMSSRPISSRKNDCHSLFGTDRAFSVSHLFFNQ